MRTFRERTRFATVLAVGAALVASGVVAGAAGGNFILGAANSAGTSNSSLTTASTGNALLVTQNGSGTAIRGSTGSGSGIAGFFTSGSGSGVSGVVANENKYGVYAANDSANEGTGAALRVNGKQNKGIVATSDDTNAVEGVVTNCDGFVLCGANGIYGKGYAFGSGVYGDGTDGIAGVTATEGGISSVYATATNVAGIYSDASAWTSGYFYGQGSYGIGDCDLLYCAGLVATGDNGVLAGTATTFGFALYGEDATGDGSAYALVTSGDASIGGDLFVDSCTGCTLAATAVNTSKSTLQQGDAVTLVGVETAEDGSIVLQVAPAKNGDAVFGVVDREVSLLSGKVTTKATKSKVWDAEKGEHERTNPARELKGQGQKWMTGGTKVSAGAMLRVVTSGMLVADASYDAASGDALAVGEKAGKLGKAGADAKGGTIAGKYVGKLKDGSSVLLVDPS